MAVTRSESKGQIFAKLPKIILVNPEVFLSNNIIETLINKKDLLYSI